MPMAVSTVTRTGQVTLPKEFRDILGIGVQDQVVFLSDGKRVEVAAVPEDPLTLKSGNEFWDGIEQAREDYAAGRFMPAGATVARLRAQYGL